jgi:hypothetical protein
MKVLILSSPEDTHAQAVEGHLKDMGVGVDYLRFNDLLQQCKVAVRLEGGSQSYAVNKQNGELLDLSSYSSIWHRRPGRIQAGQFIEPWIGQMVEQETRAALDGIFASLPCLWVNHPRNDYACMQKLWQLKVASDLGLSIPRTVVTNDPEVVREFVDVCDGDVVYKLISELSNRSIPAYEEPRGVCTLPLRTQDLEFIDQVGHAMHLFQKRIEKAYELRVTVVGSKIFCVRIDSQSGSAKLDWRNDYSVNMEPSTLPEDISRRILALMKAMGLNYGAMDFCVTHDGQQVFLEINPVGQYLWLEQRCQLPISLELARLLAHTAEPLAHSVSV